MTIEKTARPDLSRAGSRPAPLSRLDLSQIPDPADDPLAEVEYAGDIETDSAREMTALEAGFKARAQQEQERFRLATDSEFWFAVCFQSREQKEAFLAAMEWLQDGDKYLDGTALARQMNIDIPQVQLQRHRKSNDRKLRKLVVPM